MDPKAPKSPAEFDKLTLKSGAPVGDKLNSLLLGARGPNLLADISYLEETAHFNRERIPERVVHAKGAAAYGHFIVTNTEIARYTKACVFSRLHKRTPVVARFSHVTGESGISDSTRDVRGFAVRFKSEQGNWDIVGNNLPVFFVSDPINFSSFIHSQKRNPKTHLRDPDAFWDFVACKPETLHTICMLFSDRGIPDGFRHMHGFGVNTFKLVNDKNEFYFAKFHWITNQKIRNLEPQRAAQIAGLDPDYYFRDLQVNISAQNYPSWTLNVQVMSAEQANAAKFDIFNVTKVWPHADYPLIEVGNMTLDKNVENYFAETEQLAFSPSNMIAGIEASQDKMLVGRMMSYPDAQRYRLGVNHPDMPCNKPVCPVMTPTYCDGITYMSNVPGSIPNYVPSIKFKKMKLHDERFLEHKQTFGGHVGRFDTSIDDVYSQPRALVCKVLDKDARKRLATNIYNHIRSVKTKEIIQMMLRHFEKIDPLFAKLLEGSSEASHGRANTNSSARFTS